MNEAVTRRALTVAGVAGGVGTTTIARALAAVDRGVFTGRPVDVLVCRSTADSLLRAARAAYLISTQQHRRPVLAVNTAHAAGPSRPSTARMRLLEPHTAGVVVLPYVRRWRDLATPLQDVTGLLGRPVIDPDAEDATDENREEPRREQHPRRHVFDTVCPAPGTGLREAPSFVGLSVSRQRCGGCAWPVRSPARLRCPLRQPPWPVPT